MMNNMTYVPSKVMNLNIFNLESVHLSLAFSVASHQTSDSNFKISLTKKELTRIFIHLFCLFSFSIRTIESLSFHYESRIFKNGDLQMQQQTCSWLTAKNVLGQNKTIVFASYAIKFILLYFLLFFSK